MREEEVSLGAGEKESGRCGEDKQAICERRPQAFSESRIPASRALVYLFT